VLNEINIIYTLALYAFYFAPTFIFFYFYGKTQVENEYYLSRIQNPLFNMQVEGLRGVLSFSVFIHHCIISFTYYSTGIWLPPSSVFYDKLGSCPVIMFFFLTGYLFFQDSMRSRILKTDYVEFLKKRFLRIYPAYFFSICLVMFFIFLKTNFVLLEDSSAILTSLLGWIFVGLPNGIFPDVNQFLQPTIVNAGVIWSLRYEVLFYFVCPIFVSWYFKNKNSLWWVLLFCLIIYATKSYGWQMLFDFSKFMVLGFSGGMLVAAHIDKIQHILIQKNVSWAVITLSVLLVSFSTKYSIMESLGLAGFFVLVIHRFKSFSFLASPTFVSLGRVSYSFYLLHGIVIYAIFNYGFLPVTLLSQILTVAALGVLVSVVSIFSFRMVEQRFYKL
jgi:peptidoglycan/LPS O-acetylase OafA/YrhL